MVTSWLGTKTETNHCTDKTQPHRVMLTALLQEERRSRLASVLTSRDNRRLCRPVGARWETAATQMDSKHRLKPQACQLAKQTSKS